MLQKRARKRCGEKHLDGNQVWMGTSDDWIGTSDRPTKVQGIPAQSRDVICRISLQCKVSSVEASLCQLHTAESCGSTQAGTIGCCMGSKLP